MLPNRVHISKRASDQLKLIKSRTGVTPNILCRIALITSLNEGHKVNTEGTDTGGLEFNLPTLLGDSFQLYEALIKQSHGDLKPKQAELVLAAHIDNGVDKLKRVKSVTELLDY